MTFLRHTLALVVISVMIYGYLVSGMVYPFATARWIEIEVADKEAETFTSDSDSGKNYKVYPKSDTFLSDGWWNNTLLVKEEPAYALIGDLEAYDIAKRYAAAKPGRKYHALIYGFRFSFWSWAPRLVYLEEVEENEVQVTTNPEFELSLPLPNFSSEPE